jgi:hypothetical protein
MGQSCTNQAVAGETEVKPRKPLIGIVNSLAEIRTV